MGVRMPMDGNFIIPRTVCACYVYFHQRGRWFTEESSLSFVPCAELAGGSQVSVLKLVEQVINGLKVIKTEHLTFL